MKIQFNELLDKKVSRIEFLGLMGAGAALIFGVSSFIKGLGDIFSKSAPKPGQLNYGNDNYGGSKSNKKVF